MKTRRIDSSNTLWGSDKPNYFHSIGTNSIWGGLSSLGADHFVVPYNQYVLETIGQKKHVVEISVPGFTENELTITQKGSGSVLCVVGNPVSNKISDATYLKHGFAPKPFTLTFELASSSVTVADIESATLENGVLRIVTNVRSAPEMKPVKITTK